MDGTLTETVHDFDAIRQALDVPPGQPILEYLDGLPAEAALDRYQRLEQIERELAMVSRARPGAVDLLQRLTRRGSRVGILTRNTLDNAVTTLAVCGLDGFFDSACVMGREQALPKPHPEGVHKLLRRWGAAPQSSVMVGDYVFDLQAGRAAGTATVYLDVRDERRWTDYADVTVTTLDALPTG